MSIIVTNQITIPASRAEVVAEKFAHNSEGLHSFEGFEGFELCRPTDPEDDRWLVITHWKDEQAYQTWRDSKKFVQDHSRQQESESKERSGADSVVRHYDVAFQCRNESDNSSQ